MSNALPSFIMPKAPKADPALEAERAAAEKAAKQRTELLEARAQEQRRAAGLGFRGTRSLISAGDSRGFFQKPTLG